MTEKKTIQCPICRKQMTFEVSKDDFKPYHRFPIPAIIHHIDHWVSLNLDSDFSICDIEIPIVKIAKE